MRTFTQNDYDKLTPFISHLQRGYYGHYFYALTRKDFNALVEIYKDLGFTQKLDYSCGRCILELTKKLGGLYFQFTPTATTPKKAAVKVQQYTLDGQLVAEYDSISEAGRQTGISKGSISAAIKSGKPTGEYTWKNA